MAEATLTAGPSLVEPLYQVKLLSALRSGDASVIHPFLTEISKDKRKSGDGDIDTGAAALHLAVRCGSVQTVALLLEHRAISPNGVHPPGSGTTALHLAASLGRLDIVNLLLEQDNIDDGLRDNHGKTCRDVARGKDIVRAIDDSRSFLNASYRSLLHSYISSPPHESPSPALIRLLESPRVTFVDLSYLDNDSGASLLHEAAKRKDLRLIELAVRAGADVFVRNRRGKMAYEGAGKDDRVKVFLRQFANHDKTLISNPAPITEPPTLKGYLNKYTNVAKGYNTRWFVLKNGILSYYRHQDDETIASRGSISMKKAALHIGDRARFEVSSLPSHNHSSLHSAQKWYMKANHPVEAHRWTEAIGKSIEWCKQREGAATTDSDASSISKGPRRRSTESDFSDVRTVPSTISQARSSNIYRQSMSTTGRGSSRDRDARSTIDTTPGMMQKEISSAAPPPSQFLGTTDNDGGEVEDNGETYSSDGSESKLPPHHNFDLQGNAASAQLELSSQLLSNLIMPQTSSNSRRTIEIQNALKDSLDTTQHLLNEYLNMTREREEWFAKQLKKERARQRFWEESLAVVVKEGETLEQELRVRSRRRGSRVFGPSVSNSTTASPSLRSVADKKRPAMLGLGPAGLFPSMPSAVPEESPSPMPDGTSPPPTVTASQAHFPAIPQPPPPPVPALPAYLQQDKPQPALPGPRQAPVRTATGDTITNAPSALISMPEPQHQAALAPVPVQAQQLVRMPEPHHFQQPKGNNDDEYDTDEEEEDEFFDAIESNNLPNLLVYEHLASPPMSAVASAFTPEEKKGGAAGVDARRAAADRPPLPSSAASMVSLVPLATEQELAALDVASYKGYERLRARLAIGNDQRPSTSLWSVLKHSIGKDLTKISFPVFFNEPTSMLQRMAEDMEFSECLDVAAHEKDPLRRIAFVAAFAMSNYSSTIGRIAKPFNPMLSETFEYVRIDRQYRYVSEQVSHHPPISACWAESPSWHYYGEVDAQNKFMGKSFEIRPTGVAHAHLLLPEEMAPHYPKWQSEGVKGKVVEHYSWKKVTTNVSGFILGSPTIDHYGDMIITNHRTGDQCILTFKPRGWRGRDAYEISGQVTDAKGNVAYDIAGRWNSQLVAKQVVGHGQRQSLNPDISMTGANSPSVAPEHILLWRNSEKPAGSPFNLTPFAITLNDCPQKSLRPFLAPTDCRLRPDQRAFELGKYELANQLKQDQEEKQRAIRRAREDGSMQPHRPRWFAAETDGDTGERVWSPSRTPDNKIEYWVERDRVWREGGNKPWKDVDPIFIDEPAVVTQLLNQSLSY